MAGNTVLAAVMAVFLVGGMISAGCSDSDNDPPSALYTVWQLQEFVLTDGTVSAVDDPAKYTLTLNMDGTASVRADCNMCNGNFNADDNSLSFGLMACTLAACPPGSFDARYLAALGTASDYELTPALLLDYAGGTMRFIPAPTLFQ
jgi:heat shock protein HslJ